MADEAGGWRERVFGSPMFFRLWCSQVVSATGDWLGLLAITALAARVGGGNNGAAISLVLSARIVPGFFLGPVAGVLVDRWNRKRLMIICDVGRAGVLAVLPFIDSIGGLVVASLVMEVFTLLWSPAKEASVPHLVPADHLTAANSLSLVAAYGTFPIGSALLAVLAKLSEPLQDLTFLDGLHVDDIGLPLYVDSATFLLSALIVWTLTLPAGSRAERRREEHGEEATSASQTFGELKEGWRFLAVNPVVRAVNVGLATGLIGGGMLVPLGPLFASQVLQAGDAGFGVLTTSLGFGMAAGVSVLSLFQKRLPKAEVFTGSVLVAGASLVIAASTSTLALAAPLVAMLGLCAGAVYVLGFTLLHENVDDELRGRIFSALYTLVRLCVLIAFAVGPLLADILDNVSERLVDGHVELLGVTVSVPGVRLTLWLAGLIIMAAGVLARFSVRGRASVADVPVTAEEPE